MKKSNRITAISGALGAIGVYFSRIFLGGNFSILGSFGVFNKNPIFYAISILAFDALRGGFYTGVWWNYAGFAAYPLFGFLARKMKKSELYFVPLASVSFFLLSNFGVWWHWYGHSLAALTLCYTVAIPFFLNTLTSDLLFSSAFLFIRSLLRKKKVKFAPSSEFVTAPSK